MTEKRKLEKEDLEKHLNEQIQFLISSTISFDKGFNGEAKRMAVVIRTLLHDTASSKSLLGQLDMKDIEFLSTAIEYNPDSLTSHGGLVYIDLGGREPRYLARLDEAKNLKKVSFSDWWNEIIFADEKKKCVTRRDLILTAANQDGGAHIDPELDERYARLSKDNSMGWVMGNSNGYVPLISPELTAIRQITHELLKTLIPDFEMKPPKRENSLIIGGMQVFSGPPPNQIQKVGRNKMCPCGSGIKYKKCHGKNI